MESLTSAPETSTFVALAEHQSRTPSSFYSGPAVLHYHSQRCKIVILERELLAAPALNALRSESAPTATATQDDDEKEVAIDGVDVWVTSDKFLLYSTAASAGVSIPYPSISLHALQRLRVPGDESSTEVQGLYMQVATPSAPSADDEEECTIMTVVLPADATVEASTEEGETETPTKQLYEAVSACSNLHPDPVEPGDEDDDMEDGAKFISAEDHEGVFQLGDGGMPPPVDGSSGWITAENMDQFFDADGNWIAAGEAPSFPLGPGAGTVRAREEENGAEEHGEEDETKWQKTD
ncbi:hypothetical protein N7452_010859 [Penicillium brevicompactum]|uniref:Regulator of volume decrease after cellular swelling-domain-containing protein n=1 Tax=Penicillium brevicompactum TaxID=5074 RepID=A0A9W9Q141_PENBR|nr:hypothetical protein N7452_010859 [Penicillium brevicompactum]